MVSTRQMSIVNGECSTQVSDQGAPCRSTRNANCLVPAEPGPSQGKFLPTRQTILLLDLPVEVIEKILSYLNFKNICQLRLVSFIVCILFSKFCFVEKKGLLVKADELK